MTKFWPFMANVAYFACVACVYPFLVLYYQSLGFSGSQIGLLSGITPVMTVIGGPLWTNLADVTRRHRLIMSLIVVVALLSLLALPLLRTFGPVLLMVIVLSACFSPITSFIDSATLFMLAGEKEMYGRVRLGGTFGFGVVGYVAGVLVQDYGLKLAFWSGALALLLALVAGQYLTYAPVSHAPATRAGTHSGSVRDLLANRRWWPFLAVAFAGGLALAVSNTYLLPYMKQLGANESTMGLALAVGTLSEVPVLFFGNRLIARFGPYRLLMAAMAITGARLVLFVFSGTPSAVLWLQLLSGLTFPLMWLAGVAYAHENAPSGLAATAQGLFGAMVYGFGAAVGNFAGGPLLERLGGHTTYLIFGAVILAIVLVVALWQKRLSAQQETAGSP
jgi:PPP family 3-phenylpropionic acid transporter